MAEYPSKARLHVSQLKHDVNYDTLKARFAKYGHIFDMYVNSSKGFAFIQYGSAEEAADAIHAENQAVFDSRYIGVALVNKDKFGQSINQDDSSRQLNHRGQDLLPDRDRDVSRYREHDLPARDLPARDLPARGRDRSPLHDRYDDRILDRYDRLRDPYDRDREDVRDVSRYREHDLPARDLPARDLPARGRDRSPLHDRYDDRILDRYDRLRDPYDRDREDVRRDPLERGREPLDRGRDSLDRGRDPLDRGQDTLDRGRDTLDRGRDTLDRGRDPLDRGRDPLDRGRDPLDYGRDPLDKRRESLDSGRKDILDREKDPRDARDAYVRRVPHLPQPSLGDAAGPSTAPPPLSPSPTEKPIDCEILLLGKHLRDYADIVERRIKTLSINTGLLLSNEGSLSQVLEDVTRRKVLYAIIITSQNELHRSVTLNILHGSPQDKSEHPNMPLEDALALVDRNFSTYMYLQDRTVPAKVASSSVPPTAIISPFLG